MRLLSASQWAQNPLRRLRNAGADAASIDEPAVVGVVAKQERAEMRPEALRISPTDDNEFLTVEAFGLTP
jgi:hypothetical protein